LHGVEVSVDDDVEQAVYERADAVFEQVGVLVPAAGDFVDVEAGGLPVTMPRRRMNAEMRLMWMRDWSSCSKVSSAGRVVAWLVRKVWVA
jgi:hypothetical protein